VKVWVDDTRDPRKWLPRKYPDDEWSEAMFAEWIWVTSAGEAIGLLKTGEVEVLWVDHDLGDVREMGTGQQVLDWIEEQVATIPGFVPPECHVLTGNPAEWDEMDRTIQRIQERPWEGRLSDREAGLSHETPE
jgi:hypothetical protein